MKTVTALVLASVVFAAEAAQVRHSLDKDANVTIVIEDAAGKRIRNLVSDAPRKAGQNVEEWDGRDDNGYPAAAGEYRWRGLSHGMIESRYVGDFCSPHSEGATPWKHLSAEEMRKVEGGAGGWLSDHAAPRLAYAWGDEVFIGCSGAEEGDSIIRVTTDGIKVWGSRWQALLCPMAMAIDPEDNAIYFAADDGWFGKQLMIVRRLLKDGKIVNYPVPKEVRDRLNKVNPAFTDQQFIREPLTKFSGLVGITVIGDNIVVALSDQNRLALFDKKSALFVRDVPLADVKALWGEWAISGKDIVKIDLERGEHRPLGLDPRALMKPTALCRDKKGFFYVADAGEKEHCVKLFSPKGKPLHSIGGKGGRREGKYDPSRMENPTGVAVDSKGQAWVAEKSESPRRVSVWTKDGELVREFVGGARYGGGGSIDAATAANPTTDSLEGMIGYYGGMRFKLHDAPRQGELDAVLWRPDDHTGFPFAINEDFLGNGLHHLVKADGKRYLLSDDGACRSTYLIAEEVGDKAVLRAAKGPMSAFKGDRGKAKGSFLWQDLNGNGEFEENELTLFENYGSGAQWSLRSSPGLDMFFTAKDQNGLLQLVRFKATGSKATGLGEASGGGGVFPPRWDLAHPLIYPVGRTRHDEIIATSPIPGTDDVIVNFRGPHLGDMTNNVLMAIAPGGECRWRYPNPYPTNGFTSPVPKRGEIRHTLNCEGFAEIPGFGWIWQLNGNIGTRYLFTADGLFITELFGDQRVTPTFYAIESAARGTVLSHNSAIGECFFGWLGNGAEGRALQIIGKQTCNVCDVAGVGTLRRMKGGEVVLKKSPPPLTAKDNRGRVKLRAIEMQGNWMPNNGWFRNAPYKIEDEKLLATFAVGSGNGRTLALQIEVKDPTPFRNNGSDFTTLFHTGDAVDIRFAADKSLDPKRQKLAAGDVRYLVVPDPADEKKARVVRYTYVDKDAKTKPVVFASPVGRCEAARVEVLENCGTRVERRMDSYVLSVAIPWLHIPHFEDRLKGEYRFDVGVIFGDGTSSQAQRREYFFDKNARIVHDIPSEAGVDPSRWGVVEF